jgi:hypothetical protein
MYNNAGVVVVSFEAVGSAPGVEKQEPDSRRLAGEQA